jgi:hypothetical protein
LVTTECWDSAIIKHNYASDETNDALLLSSGNGFNTPKNSTNSFNGEFIHFDDLLPLGWGEEKRESARQATTHGQTSKVREMPVS